MQGDLVFKGHQLVVPLCLRKEMMEVIHASHIGIEGCLRRARESLYWPRMSTELKAYISTCDVCLTNRGYNPGKEPLMQHELIAHPWSKVSADLCEFNGRTLLVISDYYSNFIEVTRMTTTTSRSIIKVLKEVFARYGTQILWCLTTVPSSPRRNSRLLQRHGTLTIKHHHHIITNQTGKPKIR